MTMMKLSSNWAHNFHLPLLESVCRSGRRLPQQAGDLQEYVFSIKVEEGRNAPFGLRRTQSVADHVRSIKMSRAIGATVPLCVWARLGACHSNSSSSTPDYYEVLCGFGRVCVSGRSLELVPANTRHYIRSSLATQEKGK